MRSETVAWKQIMVGTVIVLVRKNVSYIQEKEEICVFVLFLSWIFRLTEVGMLWLVESKYLCKWNRLKIS